MGDRHTVTTILVTGAAGDIGTAIAELLARRGHRLALADHPDAAARLDETVQLCRRLGADTEGVTFDVTDEPAVTAVVEELGPLGGLVNNAGYQGLFIPVDRYPIDDARRVMEINVLGVMTVLAAAGRAMISAGSAGSVVNVASMAGVSGAPNMPAYAASKAAVIGLTKAAAKDLAPKRIRVNAVSPGFVGPGRMWETQVAKQATAGSQYYSTDPDLVAPQMIGLVPMRRYGSANEVATVVAFLLSDDASFVTGANVEVSGGSV
jgi:NAD(P)-dependent dehydrogenase (short-subunit alcohol dehydrogenase family)